MLIRKLHPARFTQIQFSPESSHRLQSTTRDDDLAYSYRNVFGAVLKRDSRLLHDLFSAEEFVLIQMNTSVGASGPNGQWGPADATGSLDRFFEFLAKEHNSPLRVKWELPLSANDFVNFLSTGTRDQIVQVVNYISNSLRSFCPRDPFLTKPSSPADHAQLPDPDAIHPALPYLWFTAHLVLKSRIALWLFEEANLLDVFGRIFFEDMHNPNQDMVQCMDEARSDLQFATCLILGAWSAKSGYPSLARRLRDDHLEFFVRVFTVFVARYQETNAFRLPSCDSDPPDDRRDFYLVLMEHLR